MSRVTAATTPKGERRRAALVAAAGELLVEGGFDCVRHRSVAQRARIPLAATTYYFESLGDLVTNAVAYAGDHDVAGVRERASVVTRRRRGAQATAEILATVFFPSDSEDGLREVVSRYERLVVSTRDPRLQDVQARLREELTSLHIAVLEQSGRTAERRRVQRLMAVEDGAALGAFTRPDSDPHRVVRDAVADVVDTLAPAAG